MEVLNLLSLYIVQSFCPFLGVVHYTHYLLWLHYLIMCKKELTAVCIKHMKLDRS